MTIPALSLTGLWVLPAAGAAALWLLPLEGARAKAAAVGWAALVLAYALALGSPFAAQTGALRLEASFGEPFYGIHYRVGADGLSMALCWLTSFLTVLALAGMRGAKLSRAYWACFLALEAGLLGVFVSQNLFYFYVFWEVVLIPMFFIIGVWGAENRRYAAVKFILYTFLGSLFMLVGVIALPTLHHQATGVWTWDLPDLARTPIAPSAARWIFAAIGLGFAVKIPVFPLHGWLPDAHTEAPAAGSILLAGAMLKMGVYGFMRVLIPVFPELSAAALPWLGALGVVNILYGALCAMAQTDLKRLVAYTSISHLGFCLVGLFSLTAEGVAGSSLQMINHGLSTGGLFLLVGMLYDRAHRRGVEDFGALASTAPWFSFFFGVVLLSSIGLPGLNGFVGEMMSLAGMARALPALAFLGLGGTILAAAYALPAYQKVFWAPAGEGSVSAFIGDLDLSERTLLSSLTALIVWLGVYPRPLLSFLEPAVLRLVTR